MQISDAGFAVFLNKIALLGKTRYSLCIAVFCRRTEP